MRRRIAAFATAAPAVATALSVSISRHDGAKPDKVEPHAEGDLIRDSNETQRYEASAHMPPPRVHEKEQARLNKDGYRPRPDTPIPFIDATCEEICSSDCATQGLGAEVDTAYQASARGITGMVPQAVENAFGSVGDYFKDIAESLVPGMNFMRTKKTQVQKKSSSTKDTSSKVGNGQCLVSCKAAVDKCADNMDSSDSLPEQVEEYTTVPQTSHCQDIAKLRIIAETGNLKWSLRFGQSPTFGQIASLAEPFDLITQADLQLLGRCAEGGDFASINLGNAIGLAKCMVGEVDSYAHSIADGIKAVHSSSDEEVEDPEMNPVAVDPIVADENGEFHMGEDIFYVNDVRCFSGCASVKVAGILDSCSNEGHSCASDFADLLWRTGTLYAPTTMGNAVNEMGYAHATDTATKPVSLLKDGPVVAKGKELLGTVDPAKAAADAAKAQEKSPEAPAYIAPEQDHTSPLYDSRAEGGEKKRAPAFCKMQMCAPYPATWVKGKLLERLFEQGSLEQCPNVGEVRDVHPHAMYEGTMKDPMKPAATTKFLDVISAEDVAVHSTIGAREMAIERRQKNWARGALQAAGRR